MESLLGSKPRVKILKVLIDKGELNITAIAREAGVNHKTALRHLEELRRVGVVTEKVFGRVRIFKINSEDPRVEALKMLFKSISSSERK
ncbi:ArsR family transcriptional regulator [Candidatus Nezhaarchaeota archaeon WYZ-LMO8]|nr:MAG: ArsR family transcriptional regulator [Candidatus Nezhaarchaeota archaeon WYZ-LMO8]TDA37206.1 MAG: ArsR family transcriptional regulator [Candidatus Nezhaarchaeota archaeon WYZ-LMO7]